jgi:two-component system sensor histidine kinase CpxA
MNTVYGRIAIWALATVLAGFLAVLAISFFSSMHLEGRTEPTRYDALLLENTVAAWRSGGAPRLREEIERMDRHLNERYYLTDASGRDLLTGVRRLPAHRHPWTYTNVFTTADGQFRLVDVNQSHFHFRATLPYHGLLLVVVAVLCGVLAANIASPLRRLAQAVDRFGAGDLSARVHSKRRDEIGDVSRAFDRMADRISTLLTAERRLLQDISHELRSPLARLAFAAELTRTAPDRDAAVERLKKEIARLTDLVGGLIQVTRAEGDPDAAASQVLRLDELIGELVEDCRLEAAQRGCTISWSPGPAVTLRGDREVLRRAVENVLRNAVRHTAPESSVEVVLGREASSARLSIRDFGTGVPAESLERIFTPFFRLDDSRESGTGGLGLGLAIAQRAVILHYGRVWAENASPGLRVVMELPVS